MNQQYETISDDAVISFDKTKSIPMISCGMLGVANFYKLAEKSNEVYKWMEESFDCRILHPKGEWRTGKVSLATLFEPLGIELIGKDIAMSTIQDEDALTSNLPFFSPFDLIRVAETDRHNNNKIYPWLKTGFDCRVLIPKQDWQYGTVKISLVFYPDEDALNPADADESSLDEIRRTMSEAN